MPMQIPVLSLEGEDDLGPEDGEGGFLDAENDEGCAAL